MGGRIEMDGFFGAAVHAPVGLLIADEPFRANPDAAGN